MNSNILLSKIVANPTDTTWSQAYSTLNLYIVLSIQSEVPETSIVTSGKELLERLQREYFSQDEKNLENIKKSVEKTIESRQTNESISVVLATISEDILYIVFASKGEVVFKRNGKIGTIGKGEEDKIVAFSGKLTTDDIIIIETGDFSNKVPVSKLSEVLDDLGVSEISESLAPLIHEGALGTEAAIVIQYKNIAAEDQSTEKTVDQDIETGEDESIEDLGLADESQSLLSVVLNKIRIPNINILGFGSSFSRKKLTILMILFVVVLLFGSIMFERGRQEKTKREQALAQVLVPSQKKYDEAVALINLNKGLALEEFESLKKTLEEERKQFNEKTDARKKLDELIGKIEGKIGELGSGATVNNQKVIFNASENDIKEISLVSFKNGSLTVANTDGKIAVLNKDGKSQSTFDSKNKNSVSISSDASFVYLLGDSGITRTDKKSGKTSVASEDADGSNTGILDTFLGNVYLLNKKSGSVDKFQTPSFAKKDYFTEKVTLKNPSSLSIDSSIWIVDAGKVRKFTKGAEETFLTRGLTKNFGSDAQIFTDRDYSNIYILDPSNMRIASIAKDEELKNQYSWRDLSSASSFSVNEKDEKVLVVINNKLYSFDL